MYKYVVTVFYGNNKVDMLKDIIFVLLSSALTASFFYVDPFIGANVFLWYYIVVEMFELDKYNIANWFFIILFMWSLIYMLYIINMIVYQISSMAG